MTTRSDAIKNSDIAFLQQPGKWALYPYCPLKRYVNGDLETAVAVAPDRTLDPRSSLRFYRGANVYDNLDTHSGYSYVFRTPEDIIEEGWEVD